MINGVIINSIINGYNKIQYSKSELISRLIMLLYFFFILHRSS